MRRTLLAIVELGGYPNFTPLYRAGGYTVVVATSMRKALALVKKHRPELVVAEFNFQSDFRDRTSNLESLLATLQTRSPRTRVIVFYELQHVAHLDRLRGRFPVFRVLPFPIDAESLREAIETAGVCVSPDESPGAQPC
jgi:DNA-binding NtrC family response regulator